MQRALLSSASRRLASVVLRPRRLLSSRERMEYDVVIVGAGPAGLSAAIRLKQLEAESNKAISVCVLEKGSEVGAHIVSGNVLEPRALDELLPDWRSDAECPIKTKVTTDKFLYLTGWSSISLPTPPMLNNHGNYITSLSQVTRWLGKKAEELGVEIYAGFAASEVLYERDDGDDKVVGVATKDVGIRKDGTKKETFERGVEVRGKETFFAEGARGSCSEAIIRKYKLRNGPPQVYGLGVKEVWRVPNIDPGFVQHTLGWPLKSDVYGGSFLYHLGEPDLVQVGFVVGLDYKNPSISPYKEFQRFKHHPAIAEHLRGGECVGYGARIINEGGYQSIPELLSVNGASLIGCSAGFLNVPKIKGTHTAMKSGMLAAEAAFDVIHNLSDLDYDTRLRSSWVYEELRAVRNYKPSFEKAGLWGGMAYSGLSAYVLKGNEPWTFTHSQQDSKTTAKAKFMRPITYPKPDNVLSFPLLDNLARANVYHEPDQPSHLKVKPNFQGIVTGKNALSLKRHEGPEQHFCPAGVYEYPEDRDGNPQLLINAQNCIHCKCCAVKMPYDYIDWTVPEGGGGPNYHLT